MRLKPKGPERQPQVFFQWLWVLSLPPEHRLKTVSGTISLANNHTLSTLIRTCHVICKDQCNMKMQESLSAITKNFKMVGVEHESKLKPLLPRSHTPEASLAPSPCHTNAQIRRADVSLCSSALRLQQEGRSAGLGACSDPTMSRLPYGHVFLGPADPASFSIFDFADLQFLGQHCRLLLYMRTPGSLAKVQGRETQIREHSPRARQGKYLLSAQALLAGVSELHSPYATVFSPRT